MEIGICLMKKFRARFAGTETFLSKLLNGRKLHKPQMTILFMRWDLIWSRENVGGSWGGRRGEKCLE
jgi:hypothetical protein